MGLCRRGVGDRNLGILGARLGSGVRCYRGWEGFSARGGGRWSGVPSVGGAADGMMLQATMEVSLTVGRRSM